MMRIAAFFASAIGRLIIVLLLAAAIFAALSQCRSASDAGKRAKLSENQAKAGSSSAAGAIGTIGAIGDRAQQGDDLTRSNENEIRNAPGAGQAIDPGLRDAGLDSLCKRAAYRGDKRCLPRADPAGMAGSSTGGSAP